MSKRNMKNLIKQRPIMTFSIYVYGCLKTNFRKSWATYTWIHVDPAAPFKKLSKVTSLYAICDPVIHAKDWTTMCNFVFSQKQTIFFDW